MGRSQTVTRLQAWMPMAGAAGRRGSSTWHHQLCEANASKSASTPFLSPHSKLRYCRLPVRRALVCVQSRPEPSPGTTMKRFRLASLTLVTLAAAATICMASNSARAHPHVWITAKVEVIFSASVATAIRHRWTFDPGYSAYVTQGLTKNADGKLVPDELLQLAKENVES